MVKSSNHSYLCWPFFKMKIAKINWNGSSKRAHISWYTGCINWLDMWFTCWTHFNAILSPPSSLPQVSLFVHCWRNWWCVVTTCKILRCKSEHKLDWARLAQTSTRLDIIGLTNFYKRNWTTKGINEFNPNHEFKPN